jgi:hypothetical protein
MNRRIRWTFCALTTLACVASLGCESSDKKDAARDRDRIARRERNRARDQAADPVIARDRRSDRIGDRGRGADEIPAQALAVDGGPGVGVEYEPSRDGVIYVYDVDADRVIYVGRMRDRERFRLDPEGGRGLINSRTVFRSDLNPRHRYRLYFERAN